MIVTMLSTALSVGIIDGADGPTAVYVAGGLSPLAVLLLVGAGIAFGFLLVRFLRRR